MAYQNGSPSAVGDDDLDSCVREPIHIPGTVQSYGALLVLRGRELTVIQGSVNTAMFFGRELDQMLGRSLAEVVGTEQAKLVRESFEALPREGVHHRLILQTAPAGRPLRLRCALHVWQGQRILEARAEEEGEESGAQRDTRGLEILLKEVGQAGDIFRMAATLAQRFRALSGYDRVMVYRFHPDWSGEVIAEDRAEDMVPFIGLRYPATDIPAQARRLYVENLVRIIADVDAVSLPIRPTLNPISGQPLDMSQCLLRSVSPIHIEYLRNMGVGATLAGSILRNGQFWGLIACHHRSRRQVHWHLRDGLERVLREAGRRVETLEDQATQTRKTMAAQVRESLHQNLREARDPGWQLLFGPLRLTALLRASGALLYMDGRMAATGAVPDVYWVEAFLSWVAARSFEPVFATHALPELYTPARAVANRVSGALVILLARQPMTAIVLFRQEVLQEVHWGGDPSNSAKIDQNSQRVSPRKSFALWREIVRGTASPWEPEDVDLAEILPDLLGALRPDPAPGAAGSLPRERVAAVLLRETIDQLKADMNRAEQPQQEASVPIDSFLCGFDSPDPPVAEALNNSPGALGDRAALSSPVGFPPGTALPPWSNSAWLDSDPDALLLVSVSAGGRLTAQAGNSAFAELAGTLSALLPGQDVGILLPTSNLSASHLLEAEVTPLQAVFWHPTRGARRMDCLATTLLRLEGPTLHGFQMLLRLRDMTAVQRVEDSLRASRDTANLESQAKSDFLTAVSHELRGPLNTLIGLAEIMHLEVFGPLGNDRYRDYSEQIRGLAEELMLHVSELSELSRFDSGVQVLEETDFDLAEMIGEVYGWLSEQAAQRGIEWHYNQPGDKVPVRGDRRMLRQALLNVLTSTVRTTDRGGSVTCLLEEMPSGDLLIHVTDSGSGLTDETLYRLVTPQEENPVGQAETTARKETAGEERGAGPLPQTDQASLPNLAAEEDKHLRWGSLTLKGKLQEGLSLPLARRIIELHGGAIHLSSRPGHGTQVAVTLPWGRRKAALDRIE